MWPLWKYLPPGLSHELAPLGLAFYTQFYSVDTPQWKPLNWKGIHFPNRLGIAAGLDKNADYLEVWQKLGAGFVEIGTVTPRPQLGNPGKIVDRDWKEKNLWNRMGFPSAGAGEVQMKLANKDPQVQLPILCNIGKNRNTSSTFAVDDYIDACQRLAHWVDAFVINVSSPNTVGLRELQAKKYLYQIVKSAVEYSLGKPILVKLSPDLSEQELSESLDAALNGGASGFVLTNTTLYRPTHCPFPKEGGLSGHALADLSKTTLIRTLQHLGSQKKDLLLVSVGGVLSAKDVEERLAMGADLVQVYSSLVFNGPRFFQEVSEVYAQQ